jgi:glyoxylase-like metal-dependent hydrolase (beta-lactamase superfamily II)
VNTRFERVGAGVFAIDTDFVRPRMDASYLIVDHGRAAFVDTGTYHSVPNLLAALAAQGLDPGDVEYILLTHVHLDHAGGAGRLSQALPAAKVLVHPRGAAHLVDPSRLVAAARAVYGDAMFAAHYHEITPIPGERIVVADDGFEFSLGHRGLRAIHTPGHALHHLCIHDRDTCELFSGDTFGVSYREFDTAAGAFIFPTTSPSQFDPDQLHASVDRIVRLRPDAVFLTHYGRVTAIDRLGADLHADIDAFVVIAEHAAEQAATTPERVARMESDLSDHLTKRLSVHAKGAELRPAGLLDTDIALNAAGLAAWLARRAA